MYIYKAKDIREADAAAEAQGLDPVTLMENAGRAIYETLSARIDKSRRILILSGSGNNGGDGIVLARYLKQNGYKADLDFPLGEAKTDTAKAHFEYFRNLGFRAAPAQGNYDVIVDALFGIGTRLPLPEKVTSVIDWANKQEAYKIAIDVPTGVLADSGTVQQAFKADLTLSLHGYKPSAFLEGSLDYYGETQALDIGLPHTSGWKVWSASDVRSTMAKRKGNAHKGTFGTGLLIAGSDEMPGSCLLASLGCMKSGIGKLTVATSRYAAAIIASKVPECTYSFDGLGKLADGEHPSGVNAIAIGPGLTEMDKVKKAVDTLLTGTIPVILDAGALHKREYPEGGPAVVVTPHPGEFSRMTGMTTDEIQRNRLQAAANYAKEHNAITVLKGRNTVVAHPDGRLAVNPTGNPALAKGGTGDTLTGMILSFVCQRMDPFAAAINAVYLHGACADKWTETKSAAAMTASDLSSLLPAVMKDYEA